MSEEEDEPPKPEVISREEWEKMSSAQREAAWSFSFEGFASPLLPPEILERYGNVIPGLDGKLVEWAEEETRHRRSLEREAFEEAKVLRNRSAWAGPVVAVVGLLVSAAVIVSTNSAPGAFVGSVIAIVSVGGPFAARVLASQWRKPEESQSAKD